MDIITASEVETAIAALELAIEHLSEVPDDGDPHMDGLHDRIAEFVALHNRLNKAPQARAEVRRIAVNVANLTSLGAKPSEAVAWALEEEGLA